MPPRDQTTYVDITRPISPLRGSRGLHPQPRTMDASSCCSVRSAVIPRRYTGACHCGALTFRYDTELPSASWPVRACQCSFCRLHAALTSSDPAGTLSFHASDVSHLQRYRFGARTADFLVCRRCGAYLGAVFRSSAPGYGLVNLRTLRPIPGDLCQPEPMNYDGESPLQRMARRELRWTPLALESV